MINILPERGRAQARRIYLLRLSSVALCAASAALLIMAAFLSSGYLNSLAEEEAARGEALAMENQEAEGRELEAPVAAARDELDAYEPLLERAQVSVSIASVLAARDPAVTLSLISYDRTTGIVRVSGIADTRESLLAFERAARRLPLAAEVILPVSDLARSTNAPFSLTIRLAEEAP